MLVGGEIAVDFVDNLLVLLLGLGHSQQFLVVAVVHVVFECPVVEGVEVGRDDDCHTLFVFAHHHSLLYILGLAEFVFEQLRGNVFACGEFEDVFLAVGDAKIARASESAHKFTHIAGMEPTVGVDDLGGVFGILVVAQHDVGSAGEDFAVVGKGDLHTTEHGAYGAYLHIALHGVVHRNDGRSFGEAIAFVDIDAGSGKGADDAGLDAGGAGDDNEAVAAETLAPVAVDHTLIKILRELVAQRHFLEEGIVVAGAMFEGAGVYFLLETAEVLACGIEFVVYHFEHTRHSAEAVGVDFGQVLLDGAHILGIIDAAALVLEVVVHAALVHVVEREEAEHAALAGHGVDLGVGQEVAAEVAMGKHDPLGHTGGAGSVDEGGPIVGFDILFELLDYGAVFLAGGDAGLEDFECAVLAFDRGQGIDHRRVLHFLEGGPNAAEQDVVADKHKTGAAVGENVQIVVGTERWIDRDMDDAGHGQRHIDEIPLGTVVGDGDDTVAGLETDFQQAIGHVMTILIIIVGAVADPFTFLL